MSSRTVLDGAVRAFSAELTSFVQRTSDSITALKRTLELRPQAGVQDFKECLEDLEQQVADVTDELQQLFGCTADTISFEELLGHCSAVYHANRAAALALEQHLGQYGYTRPPGTVLEPEALADCDSGDDEQTVADQETGGRWPGGGMMTRSLPASPVSKGLPGQRCGPSRLGLSQPGSPAAPPSAAPAARSGGGGGMFGLEAAAPPPATMLRAQHGLAAHALCQAPSTVGHGLGVPLHAALPRASLGSNMSSTPAGGLISPGVAALASKYATSSVGGDSAAPLSSLPEQPPSAGRQPCWDSPGCSAGGRPRRTACRDLTLSYALADANSPDLPIFGRDAAAAAAAGSHGGAQQQQGGSGAANAPAGAPADRRAQHAAAAPSPDEDSTGELYSSIIHSNMSGLSVRASVTDGARAVDAADSGGGGGGGECTPCGHRGRAPTPVTPPSLRLSRSCPASPCAPGTAGRLPADWHSTKMRELEDLQADVTLTLSQMKRAPSQSRLAALAAAEADDSEEGGAAGPAGSVPASPQASPRHLGRRGSSWSGRRGSGADGGAFVQPDDSGTAATAAPAAAAALPAPPAAAPAAPAPAVLMPAPAAASDAAQHASRQQRPQQQGRKQQQQPELDDLMQGLSLKYALPATPPSPAAGADSPCEPAAAAADSSGGAAASLPGSPAAAGDSPGGVGGGGRPLAGTPAAAASAGPASWALPGQDGSSTEESDASPPCSPGSPPAAAAAPGASAGVGGATLLTPATQHVIRAAVAAGLDATSARPRSSIRQPQATTDLQRLEVMRGRWSHCLQQQQQQGLVAQNLDGRMAASSSCSGGVSATAAVVPGSLSSSQQQQAAATEPEQLVLRPLQAHQLAARSASSSNQQLPKAQPAAAKQQQEQQAAGGEQALTPRAARLQRRLQLQQQQQGAAAVSAKAAAPAAAAATPQPVSEEEYGQLPGWCRSLLTLELLNSALAELAEMAAGRAARRSTRGATSPAPSSASASCADGFTSSDLELLGHSSSRAKALLSCLARLNRASLSLISGGGAGSGGAAVYRLVGGT